MLHRLCLTGLTALLIGACAPVAQVDPAVPVAERERWEVPDEAAPRAIEQAEYSARRQAVAEQMEDGVLVAFGAAAPAADYLPYEQETNFRYLTGIIESDAILVIERRGQEVSERLFVQPADPAREVWEGYMLGVEGAQRETGIRAASIGRFEEEVAAVLGRHGRVYTNAPLPDDPAAILAPAQQVLARLVDGHEVVDVRPALARIRSVKSPAELDLIRRAILISNLAHREAMRALRPGMNEFEIRGLVEYVFLRNGAEGPAYSSIVASGPNATTLHYREADRYMRGGELLLMDVGASYRGYAADVTRTFPVSGTFSERQREIYQIVLDAQTAAEARLGQGATWQELNAAANEVIENGLARLGLIEAPGATYQCDVPRPGQRCPQRRLFYMHGLGHGIGLDVHDPDLSYFGPFRPGSAVTLEPGVYVRHDVLDHIPDTPENRAMIERIAPAVERYRTIGVRIEDDYVFDEAGVERVTAEVPREIDEIEALMREPALLDAGRQERVVEWYRHTGPIYGDHQ